MNREEIIKILNKEVKRVDDTYVVKSDNPNTLSLSRENTPGYLHDVAWFDNWDKTQFFWSCKNSFKDLIVGDIDAELDLKSSRAFYNKALEILEPQFYLKLVGEETPKELYLTGIDYSQGKYNSYTLAPKLEYNLTALTFDEIESLPGMFGVLYRGGCFELEEV